MATTTKKTAAKKSVVKKSLPSKPAAKKQPAKKAPAKKVAIKKTTEPKKESVVSKKVSLGSLVMVQVDPRLNGGSNVAAGQVTKVNDAGDVVNVRVVLDSDENQWLTGVSLVSKQPSDDEQQPKDGETTSETKVRQKVCWPA